MTYILSVKDLNLGGKWKDQRQTITLQKKDFRQHSYSLQMHLTNQMFSYSRALGLKWSLWRFVWSRSQKPVALRRRSNRFDQHYKWVTCYRAQTFLTTSQCQHVWMYNSCSCVYQKREREKVGQSMWLFKLCQSHCKLSEPPSSLMRLNRAEQMPDTKTRPESKGDLQKRRML